MAHAAAGNGPCMGRSEQRPDEPARPAATPRQEGMGLSSEHDQGEVQEVDSREQED
jgi:hypothetical protein